MGSRQRRERLDLPVVCVVFTVATFDVLSPSRNGCNSTEMAVMGEQQ